MAISAPLLLTGSILTRVALIAIAGRRWDQHLGPAAVVEAAGGMAADHPTPLKEERLVGMSHMVTTSAPAAVTG
jgi:hypothetical protein